MRRSHCGVHGKFSRLPLRFQGLGISIHSVISDRALQTRSAFLNILPSSYSDDPKCKASSHSYQARIEAYAEDWPISHGHQVLPTQALSRCHQITKKRRETRCATLRIAMTRKKSRSKCQSRSVKASQCMECIQNSGKHSTVGMPGLNSLPPSSPVKRAADFGYAIKYIDIPSPVNRVAVLQIIVHNSTVQLYISLPPVPRSDSQCICRGSLDRSTTLFFSRCLCGVKGLGLSPSSRDLACE